MKLEINPRGNGACPLCASSRSCAIRKKLADNVDVINTSNGGEMEIVIYTCPYFQEKPLP